MKWNKFSEDYPKIYDSDIKFIVSDGLKNHVMYQDKKGDLYFSCDPNENYGELEERLKFWCLVSDIPLPKESNVN